MGFALCSKEQRRQEKINCQNVLHTVCNIGYQVRDTVDCEMKVFIILIKSRMTSQKGRHQTESQSQAIYGASFCKFIYKVGILGQANKKKIGRAARPTKHQLGKSRCRTMFSDYTILSLSLDIPIPSCFLTIEFLTHDVAQLLTRYHYHKL